MKAAKKTTTDVGVIAVKDVDTAGAVIWWRLGGDTNLAALTASLATAGDPAKPPKAPSPAAALRRAVSEQAHKHLLARQVDGGWALVSEQVQGDALSYKTEAIAKLDANGECEVTAAALLRTDVIRDFQTYLGTLISYDVSSWLIRVAESLNAVSLRDTGGIYFLPAPAVAAWRKVAGALKAVTPGASLFEVPALKSDEAVAAILDAVAREAEAEADKIAAEVAADETGARALATRKARLDAVLGKLTSYEDLLGANLETIKKRVHDVEASVSLAILAAEADDAEAA